VEARAAYSNQVLHSTRVAELAAGDQIAVGYYIALPQCLPIPFNPPASVSLVVDTKSEVGEQNENNNSMEIL
jgi:hypothetical protein